MIKNRSKLQLDDIPETKKRIGCRKLGEARLRLVSAGRGLSCTLQDDSDLEE